MFTFVGAESINSGATTPWAVVDSGKLKNAGARCRHDPAESANGRPMGRKGESDILTDLCMSFRNGLVTSKITKLSPIPSCVADHGVLVEVLGRALSASWGWAMTLLVFKLRCPILASNV